MCWQITPAPNFPIYYAVYRLYSHYKARGGCKAICSGLDHLRAQQIEAMRLRLLDMEKTGHVFPNGSWAARVLRDDKGYFDLLERANTYRQEKPLEWVPRFVASATLEEIVQPAMRMRRPLPDEAAMKLGQQLEIPGLMEYVARARRRAVGSMFPTSVE
ncbi:unnamed protein product [Ostreobium quekettii]|uniref:Uncharacterized protein n=1 Tax=Ostreobium quekettii TaxID=121088 RepID=A0A8S1J0J2_9CHLO|nr:unnamed protein product [Ostreobium quekettii]